MFTILFLNSRKIDQFTFSYKIKISMKHFYNFSFKMLTKSNIHENVTVSQTLLSYMEVSLSDNFQ